MAFMPWPQPQPQQPQQRQSDTWSEHPGNVAGV
jgi:hypothetical protein